MSSEYKIENELISLTVSDHGAEIRSLIKNDHEYMWQADPSFWGRTSPILFPLVGNYYNKKSLYDGKTYEMSQHGFARDMDFELVEKNDAGISFELKSNENTLKKYPFQFVLQIKYELKENSVNVTWSVKNTNDTDMYFSIGGHPAFNCDLNSSKLLFEKDGALLDEDLVSVIIESDGSGCLSDRSKNLSLRKGVLSLTPSLFDEDALIIENRQADVVTILDENNNKKLRVSFDAPLFGIWSPSGKNAPFVCIEPWYGRCDKVGFSGDLTTREYSNKLCANEIFNKNYSITLY